MNILIKLTCLVGLVISPILGNHGEEGSMASKNEIKKEISVVVNQDNDTDMTKAVVTTTKMVNGKKSVKTQVFEGSEQEVEEKVQNYSNKN